MHDVTALGLNVSTSQLAKARCTLAAMKATTRLVKVRSPKTDMKTAHLKQGVSAGMSLRPQPTKARGGLKVLATIPYFNFHFFPHLLIFLQFRDPSYVLNLSTKAFLQKWYI